MTLLRNILLLVGLVLAPAGSGHHVSLKVERAVGPAPAVQTLATGLVVAEIEIDPVTGSRQTRALHGEPPFVSSALDALRHWRFSVPPGVMRARASVTFLFRPPAIYWTPLKATPIRPWMPGEDTSALPQHVTDPGYPPAALAEGSVILEAQISAEGLVTGIETVSGIAELTEQARAAVRNWRFSPAIHAEEKVASAAFVVIVFVLPG